MAHVCYPDQCCFDDPDGRAPTPAAVARLVEAVARVTQETTLIPDDASRVSVCATAMTALIEAAHALAAMKAGP